MPMRKNGKAFTLIELLITVTIIGILASIVLVSLSEARLRAQTKKALTELQSIHTAIEGYYALHGEYPRSRGWQGYYSCWGADLYERWIPEIIDEFGGQSLPRDPRHLTDCSKQFLYYSDGTRYKLISHNPVSMYVPQNLIDPMRRDHAWGFWSKNGRGL